MKCRHAVLVAPLLLGGCVLPLPVQIAGWAADGFSFLATGKSVSDHGLSAVAGRDCALWRGVVEGEVCIDAVDDGTAVADAGEAVEDPVSWTPPAGAAPASDEVEVAALAPLADDGLGGAIVEPEPAPTVSEIAALDAGAFETAAGAEPTTAGDGFYYVIGSFAADANADRFSRRHAAFGAAVVEAEVSGRTMHRVVVGPVAATERPALRGRIVDAGIADVWAVRLDAAPDLAAPPAPEVAALDTERRG